MHPFQDFYIRCLEYLSPNFSFAKIVNSFIYEGEIFTIPFYCYIKVIFF